MRYIFLFFMAITVSPIFGMHNNDVVKSNNEKRTSSKGSSISMSSGGGKVLNAAYKKQITKSLSDYKSDQDKQSVGKNKNNNKASVFASERKIGVVSPYISSESPECSVDDSVACKNCKNVLNKNVKEEKEALVKLSHMMRELTQLKYSEIDVDKAAWYKQECAELVAQVKTKRNSTIAQNMFAVVQGDYDEIELCDQLKKMSG